jgi:hypothetical protein
MQPQQVRQSPFRGDLSLNMLSPSRREPVVNEVPQPEIVTISDSPLHSSPPKPKMHPYFTRVPVAAPAPTHEMRFHATVASPHRPTGRQTGRLRVRVSTPPAPPAVAIQSAPRLQIGRKVQTLSPGCSPMASLSIWTPPRDGFPDFVPKTLFPDSPPPPPLIMEKSVGTETLKFCDAGVQTSPRLDHSAIGSTSMCDANVQSSPRLDQPATLRDVRNELRALLIGLGF